jgi:hypothetical protein
MLASVLLLNRPLLLLDCLSVLFDGKRLLIVNISINDNTAIPPRMPAPIRILDLLFLAVLTWLSEEILTWWSYVIS